MKRVGMGLFLVGLFLVKGAGATTTRYAYCCADNGCEKDACHKEWVTDLECDDQNLWHDMMKYCSSIGLKWEGIGCDDDGLGFPACKSDQLN